MKKIFCALMAAMLIVCACGISAAAEEEPAAEPRVADVRVTLNDLYVSAGNLRYNLGVAGAAGTTKVGYRNAKVYRYTGTYWAYEGSLENGTKSAASGEWKSIAVPNVGSGTYHVVGTAYAIKGGVEYSVSFTSPSAVL